MSTRFVFILCAFLFSLHVNALTIQPNMVPYYSFKTKLWGVSDSTGKIIIPVKYGHIELPTPGIAVCRLPVPQGMSMSKADIFKSDGSFIIQGHGVSEFHEGYAVLYNTSSKQGLIDSVGRIVLQPAYDAVMDVKEGIAICYTGKTWSAVNVTGRVLLKSDTMTFSRFNKGRCWVRGERGRLGSADVNGKIFWHPKQYAFNTINHSSYGDYCKVGSRSALRCMGLVDYFGNEIVPPRFTEFKVYGPVIIVEVDNKQGAYSRSGKELLAAEYYRIEWLRTDKDDMGYRYPGSRGLSQKYLYVELGYNHGKDKSGVMDTTGKMILPFDFWFVECVYDGIFKVHRSNVGIPAEGFIDSTGNVIAPLKYKHVTGFRYGVAGVCDSSGYHLIDRRGMPVNQITYRSLEVSGPAFPDSLFLAAVGREVGLINPRGEVVIPMKYDYIGYRDERYMVEKDKLWGVLSLTGKEIWPIRFSWIGCYANGYGWAKLDTSLVVVDSLGNVIMPDVNCATRVTSVYNEDCASGVNGLKCNGKITAWVDEKGKIIQPLAVYDKVKILSTYIKVEKDGKSGALDRNYNVLLPLEENRVVLDRKSSTIFYVRVNGFTDSGVFENINGIKYYEE